MAWVGQTLKDIRSAIRLLRNQDPSSYLLVEDRHAFLMSRSLSRLAYSSWKVVNFFVCWFIALLDLVFLTMICAFGFCIPSCSHCYKELVDPDDPDDLHELESPTAHKVAEWKEVWKHQCQEPLPLPRQKSDTSRKKPLVQHGSVLSTKLPLEVPVLVYKYAMCYNAEHCHVLEVGPRVDENYKPIPNRIYTMPYTRP